MFKVDELAGASGGIILSGKPDSFVSGISIDSRTLKNNEAFLAIKGNNFDGHQFIAEAVRKGATAVIAQRRVFPRLANASSFIKVKDTTRALGDLAQYWRRKFDIPVIAVTGSSGKTTAKEMIAGVLSAKYNVLKNEGTRNNQIGLPMALLGLRQAHNCAVLEIGSNHFGEVKYLASICLPTIGIITNIGPAHLEYFGSLQGVLREKYTLIENLRFPHIAFLNADDGLLRGRLLANSRKPFSIGFGIKNRCEYRASEVQCALRGVTFRVNGKYPFSLSTFGYHNVYNALASISVARVLGIGYKEITGRLSKFDFPQGRLKLIHKDGLRFIDDTYNSNPLSLASALDALRNIQVKGRKICIIGDMLELGPRSIEYHRQAGKRCLGSCDMLVTVGKFSRSAAQAARRAGFSGQSIFSCDSSAEARDILLKKITPDKEDLILIKGSRGMKMEEIF